jgi:uncharacterized protein YjiS (DUF1127 family)
MSCANQLRSPVIVNRTAISIGLDWSWLNWLREIFQTFGRMSRRRRERQALLELEDRHLADVGLSREQGLRQANKWFWQ